MIEDQALALAGTLGALVLVVGSLMARRLPLRTFWRLALVWLGIFGAAFMMVRFIPFLKAYFT